MYRRMKERRVMPVLHALTPQYESYVVLLKEICHEL